ncbi:MAG: MFS transporter [Angustibacter sp.]
MKRTFQNLRTSVWRHRDLRLAGPGRALSVLGDEIALIALMLHVHDSGAGTRGVMLLLGSAALPTVLLAPWAGRLADRVDSRLLTVTSALGQLLACVALAFAGPLWLVYVLVMALQAGQAVSGPTWQALVPRIVGPDEVGRAVGATQALTTLAAVGGAPLGGLLAGLGGQRLALLADATTFAVLAVVALAVRTRRAGAHDAALAPAPDSAADRPRALDGLRVVRRDALLWPILTALMVYVVVGEATNVVEVFLVRDALHGTSLQYGLVGMAVTLGIVGGSLLAGRARGARALTVVTVAAAAVQAAAVLGAGLAPSIVAVVGAFAVLGVANGAINTSTSTLVLTRVPDRQLGQVNAALNGMARGFSIGALLLGAWAGGVLGPQRTFVASGVACLLVAGWLALRVNPAARPTLARWQTSDDQAMTTAPR